MAVAVRGSEAEINSQFSILNSPRTMRPFLGHPPPTTAAGTAGEAQDGQKAPLVLRARDVSSLA